MKKFSQSRPGKSRPIAARALRAFPARSTRKPDWLPAGIARLRSRWSHDGDDLMRAFVLGRSLDLVAVERGDDGFPLARRLEAQGAPINGDFARSDTEKSAKIDNRRARLAGLIEEHIDDPPHILAPSPADLFAEDAE